MGRGGRHLLRNPAAPISGRPHRRPPRPGRVRPLPDPGRALLARFRPSAEHRGQQGARPGDVSMFARHAAGIVDVELALHASLLSELGIANSDAVPAAPTTRAYTSYLLATAYAGTFVDGFAAVLPCYWIYAEVGAELIKRGSPDPRYQRWIDSYAGEEYQSIVAEVLALADDVGRTLSPSDEARARAHFVATARYEWMFWDAAWRREAWPV
ncbi:TENA/THI-4/PQQC family protein [Mycobacterium xenopi 3993]|nr:TENA/THI-4/PQQC family protein [Mycobacterium xenopi 3993]